MCEGDRQSVTSVIPGTIDPPITTLSGNEEFVASENAWIGDTGFSHLSLFESYRKWLDLKRTEGSTYVYSKSFASWTGYSIHYQVLVVQDSVARIVRTDCEMDGSTGVVTILGEREIPTDSATYYGILSVDNMYVYAQDSVMTRSRSLNTIYLEIFDNGLLKFCKYRPNNCFDDCLFGVSIDTLLFGEIRAVIR